MIADAAHTVMFYALAAGAVTLALITVTVRRLLRAAVGLMFVLTFSAGLYILLSAEFLAGVQVLVYVGGIVVLIVFAIMLTRSSDLLEDVPEFWRSVVGAISAITLCAASCAALLATTFFHGAGGELPATDVDGIGRQLLDYGPSGYVVPFEVISLLLLAAVIGGIVIARRTPPIGQPFTSGGDVAPEADFARPLSQKNGANADTAGAKKGMLR